MGKRKLEEEVNAQPSKKLASLSLSGVTSPTIQIITGSYERVLHGVTAWLPSSEKDEATFVDSFLYQPHMSRITSLGLSTASDSGKRTLATGSADERINLYQISSIAPKYQADNSNGIAAIASSKGGKSQASGNRELGSLMHHGAQITQLWFAGKTKLLSAADDNKIAITRLRDMATLSTIKAPLPKFQNRPSGDTAAANDLPKGINSFAVHPSMKLMVSVGKGERCMRLWNLTTGKKAGVLNFDRSVLSDIGEGRLSKGEGVSVEWDPEGEEFVVAFERGALVFGMDARPKAKIITKEKVKIHRIRYLQKRVQNENIIAIGTEDGRVLFFSTTTVPLDEKDNVSAEENEANKPEADFPACRLVAQLGGPMEAVVGRIKDFEVLQTSDEESGTDEVYLVAGSSDGSIRIWSFDLHDLAMPSVNGDEKPNGSAKKLAGVSTNSSTQGGKDNATVKQIGTLRGAFSTENRITCLTAFLMDPPRQGQIVEDEIGPEANEEESSDDSD